MGLIKNIKKNWKKYLPILGIILFIYLLIRLGIGNVLKEIAKANPFFLLLSLDFMVLYLFFQTLKWFVIAKKQKINVPFMEAFRINLMSNFYGLVTPSKIGVITRVEYLKKYTKNLGKGTSNFVLDKVMDTSFIFIAAIVFSFIFQNKFSFDLRIYLIVLFLFFLLVFLVFHKKERTRFILRFFYKRLIPKKMKEDTKITFDSFYEDLPKKRYFPFFFLVNSLAWITTYISTYFIALSIGINLPLYYFLAILSIGTIVSLIPITINGLGTREFTLISLFGIFGIEATKVFSMSVISILVSGVIPALISFFFLFRRKEK
ncbi:MAG TPA: lysylphosphatidylglycerol synthase transmembrane domain-containing protein [Patescibacteria group bacterium]|nr:lysylphosphatidylglycerol synthase transmembrane domain-containing protein [Patescibacteria group bacterium]